MGTKKKERKEEEKETAVRMKANQATRDKNNMGRIEGMGVWKFF